MNIRAIFLTLPILALATTEAFAYIDPGTGSVVTTAIIGFFAAVAYTFRKYFYRMTDLFRPKSRLGKTDQR